MLLVLLIQLLLERCALAVRPPDFSNCSTLDQQLLHSRSQSMDSRTITLASGCFRPVDGRMYLKGDLEVIGQPDGSTVLDLEWRAVDLLLWGHVSKLANMSVVRTLPMWRPPLKLVPMFLDSHVFGSRVHLDNVMLHMLGRCDIVGKLSQAFGDIATTSEDGSAAFIPYSDSGAARGSNITAACDPGPNNVEQILMETSSGDQLLYNLLVLDQTGEAGLFRVTGANISTEDRNWSWPEATDSLPELSHELLMQGSRSDKAGRMPVLDFGLRPKVMSIKKGFPQLTFKDLILTNLFEQPWSDAAARDPLALLSLSFHGFLMDRSGGAKIVVRDSSIVVSEHELVVFTYWGILVNTDGTPHMDKVAPWITSLRVDRIRITPTGDGNLLIREISELRAVKFENVTLTTEFPDGAVNRIRARDGKFKGDPPALYSIEHLPLVEVRDGLSFLQYLKDTSRDKELLKDPKIILATPRVMYLTVDVRIQKQAENGSQTMDSPVLGPAAGTSNASAVTWPPEHVVLENYVVIETKQSKPDFNTLDMGYVEGLFEIRDKPVILQYLHLTNIYAPCARADCEPDASGLQLLPAFFLWPVSFNRSNTLLYVDSCTMALPARDFDLVRSMARAGSRWQQAGGPMAAFFDSFQPLSQSSEEVKLQSFEGSGMAGTRVNITLDPCTSAECQRHEARAADEILSPSEGDSRSDQKGDGSRAEVLGPAIAVPVGVVVLSALGVLVLLLVHRQRGHAGAFTNKSSSGDLTKSEKYAVAVQPSPYHTCSIRHETSANGNRSRHAKSRSQGAALEVNRAYSVDNMELEDMEGSDAPGSALQIEVHDIGSPSVPLRQRDSQRASFHLGTLTHAAQQLPSCSTLSSIPPAREQRGGGDQGLGAFSKEQADTPSPLVYIQQLVHELKTEHLVIERQLGQGGFGTVYQARWRNLPVAVKIILFPGKPSTLPPTKEDEQAPGNEDAMKREAFDALGQERAVLEAAVSSCIYHPNVVTVYHYDISEVKGDDIASGLGGLQVHSHQAVKFWKLYLIQEFMEAGDLTDAVHRHRFFHSEDGKPYLDFVVQMLLDIAHGMEHVHSQSIIHGDLNPNNILLKFDSLNTSNLRGKVADFGACHLLKKGRMHVSNVQVGTPFYMDPSTQATGRSSSASDVFSFGVIMWELFCGRPPYVPDNTGGVVKAPDFPSFPPGTPPVFVNLALQCLSIKPSERPSFAQCQEALHGLQDHLLAQIAHCQNQQLQ